MQTELFPASVQQKPQIIMLIRKQFLLLKISLLTFGLLFLGTSCVKGNFGCEDDPNCDGIVIEDILNPLQEGIPIDSTTTSGIVIEDILNP